MCLVYGAVDERYKSPPFQGGERWVQIPPASPYFATYTYCKPIPQILRSVLVFLIKKNAFMLGSTSGLSHRPLKAESRVRIPYRVPFRHFPAIKIKAPFIKSSFAFTCECLVYRGCSVIVTHRPWESEQRGRTDIFYQPPISGRAPSPCDLLVQA